MSTPLHAGSAIARSLEAHGVRRVFSVPGESYLALLDGLHDTDIHNVVCRQEGGAAYMAEAHGKLTGEPGVALVTRGPGAANAFVAVHTAWQDATPLVLFVGLVPLADRGRESFQEFDPHAWFGTQTKRVLVLDDPARASELVAEAFFAARSGRPGPVVVGLPEDMVAAPFDGALFPPLPVAEGAVSPRDLEAVTSLLREARRPLLVIGGERWTPEAARAVTGFAERNCLPVAPEWHAADRVPTTSPAHIGALAFGTPEHGMRMLEEADVVVSIGTVLGDVTTGGFQVRQRVDAVNVVVSLDPALRGRSGPVTHHVLAAPAEFATAVAELDLGGQDRWGDWARAGRRAFLDELTRVGALTAARAGDGVASSTEGSGNASTTGPATAPSTSHPADPTDADRHAPARMSAVLQAVAERTHDVLHTLGAGNHGAWARFLPVRRHPGELAPRNGSMGYSVPAAVAASLEDPSRTIVALAGDGELLMNGQELATAAQEGARFLVVVMDNGQFGTIRGHQERHFPDRVSGTQITNPDFAGLARAYGGHAETVRHDDDAVPAVERALEAVAAGTFALIHVVVDPAVLLPEAAGDDTRSTTTTEE